MPEWGFLAASARPNEGLEYTVGVDLGRVTEMTGLALVETCDKGKTCTVRQLRRYPAGVGYPDIAASVADLLARPPVAVTDDDREYRSKPKLAVGVTATGQTVGKLFASTTARVNYVTITAGDAESHDGSHYRVPKREIVGALQAALQQRALTIAAGLAEAAALVEELQGYTVKVRLGDEGDDWRREGGRLDDLVHALGLAYWCASRPQFRAPRFHCFSL